MSSEVIGSIFWAGSGMGVLLAGGQADVAPWWAVQISGLVIAFIPVLIFLLKKKDRKEITALKKVVEELKELVKKHD